MTDGKRFPWAKALSIALFAVMVCLLGWYLWRDRENMAKLLSLSAPDIVKLLALALAGLALNCVYHKIILDAYRVPLDLVDWMGVVCVSNAMAYVLPLRGELVFTGTYYKRVKGFQYVKSLSVLGGNIVFGVAFATAQVGAALLITGLNKGRWPWLLWLAWGVCALCVVALVTLTLLFDKKQPKLLQKSRVLHDVVSGFSKLLRDRRMLWRVALCLVANNIVKLLFYMVGFAAIGAGVTFYEAMLYAGVSWLTTIFAIVPGNLGIKEGVMGAATSLMGSVFRDGVAAALIQRVAVMLVYVLAGLGFGYPVWKRWNRGKAAARENE